MTASSDACRRFPRYAAAHILQKSLRRVCILFFVSLTVSFSPVPVEASTSIDLSDDVYLLFSRLEAEGIITSGLFSTKPISRTAAKKLLEEAEKNAAGRSMFINDLVLDLKKRLFPEGRETTGFRPLDSVYAKYAYTDAKILTLAYGQTREKEQAFSENNAGDLYGRGSNVRTGFTSRIEDAGPFSLYLNPEIRYSNGEDQGVLKTGYAVLGYSWINIVAGRDPQWWGPGYHGAALISNNAEPPAMIKLTAPEPLLLPWVFRYLGPFQYTVFVSRLDKDRSDFQEPYLNGVRLDFKPSPFVEIGFERIVLLGGSGRPLSPNEWLHSFIETNGHENTTASDRTDSEAGGDVKITLPFELQPIQIYWQRDGEDARQYQFGLPYKFQDIYGMYLPRLLSMEQIGLRAEYAANHVAGNRDCWYTHGVYTSGMTYNNMIIGHSMGTDSRDAFLEVSYFMPEENAHFALSYDEKTHNLSGAVKEVSRETSFTANVRLSEHVEITAMGGYGWIENPGNAAGAPLYVHEVSSGVRYVF